MREVVKQMLIEIPDEAFNADAWLAFSKMPPTKNTHPKNKRKSPPVLHRVAYELKECTGGSCVIMTMFYKAIFAEIKRRGIIIYNSYTDTWQGVDYHGD